MERYHRQTLLPMIGAAGQARLARARVLLVGCGALGTVLAEQLARAGVGYLRIVDRDLVELTNLQRQTLFDEADAREQAPKAIAAARRLARVNSEIRIDPIVADVHAGSIEHLAGLEGSGARMDLILDGTDNVETRYLLNDVAVKHGIPWMYGACVAMEGRMMAILPPRGACLRCLFPTPPGPGELPTCDTVGVWAPMAAIVASLQASAALKLLAGHDASIDELFHLDLASNRLRSSSTSGMQRPDCITCGQRRFEYLERRAAGAAAALCGRDAVQVRPSANHLALDLDAMARKLSAAGGVERTAYLLRCDLREPAGINLTLFPDGRLIVRGTTDPNQARSIYARYVGT